MTRYLVTIGVALADNVWRRCEYYVVTPGTCAAEERALVLASQQDWGVFGVVHMWTISTRAILLEEGVP